MDGQPKGKTPVAYGRYNPGERPDVHGCKITKSLDRDGNPVVGEYLIEVPPGLGPHEVDVQLKGEGPRRYHLEAISEHQHELRTFIQTDTPSMMEDSGFEILISLEPAEK